MDVLPAAPMGATHASHGWPREGTPRIVSTRAGATGFTGGPENTSSIEAPPAPPPTVRE